MPTDDLAPGMLLASPSLRDPNFLHSVVLLGRSGDEGALGWVVNATCEPGPAETVIPVLVAVARIPSTACSV